jgi:5-methylcytosine-specific restriction enzyme A
MPDRPRRNKDRPKPQPKLKPAGGRLYDRQDWRGKKGLRQATLREQPLCVQCLKEGRLVPAVHADHVKDHNGNEAAFYGNELQGLCHACHSAKTAREHGRGKS